MVVHLDTAGLAAEDRVVAVREVFERAAWPVQAELDDATGAWARMEVWDLGDGVDAVRHRGSGIRLILGRDDRPRTVPGRVALGLQTAGTGRYETTGPARTVRTGDLVLVDLTSPGEFSWHGDGAVFSVLVDHTRLALPPAPIRRAVDAIERVPAVHDVVRSHVHRLQENIDTIWSASRAAVLVGSATADMVRALVIAAADERASATGTAVQEDARPALVRRWLLQHLRDPALTPQRAADAHGMSLRALYKAWDHPEPGIARWITSQRLDAARRELARPGAGVAATARSWGFADAGHFSRRFREAYGITPRAWQQRCAEERRASAAGDGVAPDRPIS